MARWMMKFEVEGDLGVEADRPELIFRHPSSFYHVQVRNHEMAAGVETPLLYMFVLFDSDDLRSADTQGPQHLNKFLQFLSFATGSRFRVRRPMCLFDWSVDVQDQRHGYVYHHFPNSDLPQLVMNDDVVATVEELLNSDGGDADVMQALLWFSSAVTASGPEEQFQLFWFCVETLARATRDKSPVPDRCATCHEPLYCRKCAKDSKHRPYPRQAIGQLFAKFISGDAESFFRVAEKMRHALMHGDLLAKVEREHGRTLSELVDELGRLAWVALLDALMRVSTHHGKVRLRVIQPSTFLHHRGWIGLHAPMIGRR